MKNQALESIFLAWRDWRHEFLLSLCSVIALASMLAPVLILLGLENGVIDGMRAKLLQDPSILIITPKSDAGRFSREFIEALTSLPGARFAIGRTRETAADLTLVNKSADARASIALEPSAPGEPVLEHANINAPAYAAEPEIVLSTPAVKALNAKPGEVLEGRLGRRTPAGKLESEIILFHVSAILPAQAADRKIGFVPLRLLEEIENYRDYIAVPERDYAGDEPLTEREYASFRVYAKNLDAVETITSALAAKQIETVSKTREIASIKMLEAAINEVILIISLAVGLGFIAFLISSALSAASRKRRMLGMLRLLGFKTGPLVLYPMTQTLITGLIGFLLSLMIYFCVSSAIEHAFANQGGLACSLSLFEILITLGIILLLAAVSCIKAACMAAAAEPSMVIREV